MFFSQKKYKKIFLLFFLHNFSKFSSLPLLCPHFIPFVFALRAFASLSRIAQVVVHLGEVAETAGLSARAKGHVGTAGEENSVLGR